MFYCAFIKFYLFLNKTDILGFNIASMFRKTALMLALCQFLRDKYSLAAVCSLFFIIKEKKTFVNWF